MTKAYVDIVGRDLTSDAFNSAKTKLDGLSRSITAVSGAFAALGAGVFLTDATQQSLEFEKSLAKISTQLGSLTGKVNEFNAASKNLSLQFCTKAIEQSAAFYEILSAGITDTAEATALLTEANKLAIGGNATLMTSIDGLTSVIKGYGGAAGSAGAAALPLHDPRLPQPHRPLHERGAAEAASRPGGTLRLPAGGRRYLRPAGL